jgi:hypothetical protein
MFLIRVGNRYFSARRGYCGGLGPRESATLFTESDAAERSARIPGARVVPC